MKLRLQLLALSLCLSGNIVAESVLADGDHTWKDTNNAAIQAMREEEYERADKLFKQALTECRNADDRAVVNDNITVMLEKQGKLERGSVRENTIQAHTSDGVGGVTDAHSSSTASAAQHAGNIHDTINKIDAEIKVADDKGDLETLQQLFSKKMAALKVRDNSETLDYAYCMHFRAQVLHQLHRDAEADALEADGARLRDALRKLQTAHAHSPEIPRSKIQNMTYQPLPPPSNAPIQPIQDQYPSTSKYFKNKWGPRNAQPAPGDTSNFPNGNPNFQSY